MSTDIREYLLALVHRIRRDPRTLREICRGAGLSRSALDRIARKRGLGDFNPTFDTIEKLAVFYGHENMWETDVIEETAFEGRYSSNYTKVLNLAAMSKDAEIAEIHAECHRSRLQGKRLDVDMLREFTSECAIHVLELNDEDLGRSRFSSWHYLPDYRTGDDFTGARIVDFEDDDLTISFSNDLDKLRQSG